MAESLAAFAALLSKVGMIADAITLTFRLASAPGMAIETPVGAAPNEAPTAVDGDAVLTTRLTAPARRTLILRVLADGKVHKKSELIAAVGCPGNTLTQTLTKLRDEDKLVRNVGYGQWTLA